MFRLLTLGVLAAILAGCSMPTLTLRPYRIEVQQGNFISQEAVSQLKPGMTRDQVRFVLGTPLITDMFHENRWDYVYRRKRANSNTVEERRLTVFFENDRLVRLEGDVAPADGDKVAAPDAPAATK